MMAIDMPASDAYELWQRARSAVTTAVYPRRVSYTVAISGLDGRTPVIDHYRGVAAPGDGSIRIFPLSEEQLAEPPPVPHGVNVSFNIGLCMGRGGCTGIAVPFGHPAPYQDLLGEPLLAPTYTFGIRAVSGSNVPASPDRAALPVIAIVSSQARDYRVTLLDTPALDGSPTYHLRMEPLRRPKDNRLRELWIGAQDDLPRRAIVAGNFTTAPLVDVPWTIDFAVVDGAPYIARETAAGVLYLPHRRVVRDAVIAFENIGEPASIYDMPLVEPAAPDDALIEPGS